MKIKALSKIEDIIPIIRRAVIESAEMKSEQVINNESTFGPNALKPLDGPGNIYAGFNHKEGFIVFGLVESDAGLDVSETVGSNVQHYSSLVFKLYIYGDSSPDVARKIKNRLLSQEKLSQLLNEGILIESISNIRATNDFVNNAVWIRRDMDINLQVRIEYKKLVINQEYATEEEGQEVNKRLTTKKV